MRNARARGRTLRRWAPRFAAQEPFPGAAQCIRRVACVVRSPARMKPSLLLAVAVLVASLFINSALKGQAVASAPAPCAAQSADDAAVAGGYWAAWSNAASH